MAKSLPPVSAKVIADAEQFINEFKRADNAARRSSANIDREVGDLTKKLGNKFKLADFGKDVLKGAGLFGGFDLARTASEAIAGFWEKAAESAKAIEASTDKALAATMKTIAARQTDGQAEAKLRSDYERVGRQLAAANEPRKVTIPIWDGLRRVGTRDVVRPGGESRAEREARLELDRQYKELGSQIEELERKKRAAVIDDSTKIASSDETRRVAALTAGLKNQEEAFASLVDKQRKSNDESARVAEEAEKLAERYRELSDPTLRFTKQMAEANQLASAGKISFTDAARAVDALKRAMEDDRESRVNKALGDFFGDIDEREKSLRQIDANAQEIERIVGRAADGMADAWVDSLRGVEGAWGNLGDAIITEIMRVAAQILIVRPMINGLGGILSGLGGGFLSTMGSALSSYGGAKASGGGVGAGYTYRVNEDGQEFFKPDVGGTIIPVGASGGLRGEGGRGGDTFSFSYNFSSGIQRQDILPILTVWQRETLSKIADAKRRRTSLGAALA